MANTASAAKFLTGFDIEPGEDNLNLRAYIAAVLGPKRFLYGTKRTVVLSETQDSQLVQNASSPKQPCYVLVVLPSTDTGPRVAIFDGANSVGISGIPVTLFRTVGAAAGLSFDSVLLPSEQLYARSAPGQGGFSVLVSQVWF